MTGKVPAGITPSGKTQKLPGSRELALRAAQTAYQKKGEDILILDLRELAPQLAETFLLVTCQTADHCRALADEIQDSLAELGFLPHHVEGYSVGRWVLLDYLDLVIHIMRTDARAYYSLETLWGDAPTWRYPDDFEETARTNPDSGG